MTPLPAWLLIVPLVLAAPAHADRMVNGPMPRLGAPSQPAPVPDQNLEPPADIDTPGARLLPSLTNRLSGGASAADGFSPGSAFSPELERRHDTGTNIGNILAPGLQLRVPLK